MNAPRPGDLLGTRYVLVSALGEGSSATVFKARDRWLETDVAVKVFRAADVGERTESARREHEIGRDFGHAALAGALDAGRFGEYPFVVLELAAGEPLDVALRGAEPRQVAQVIDAVAGGLAALHARGLVHGDLKPANIRVAGRDHRLEARLLDFGIARPPGTAGGGTAAYVAPEALGGAAGFASDLFSLGVVSWEALTGALPFGSADDPEYLTRLMLGEPSQGAERIPDELAPILRRLLAPAAAARYASAGELRGALRTVVELPPLQEVPSTARLVDRERTLAALRAYAAEVTNGTAEPLRLVGAPRTGRSRVMALAAAEARLDGLVTLETSARAGLKPWLHALVAQAERLGAKSADGARALIDDAKAGPEARHARLFAVLQVLASAAASTPLVVFVDDADDATPSVREAIRFLAAAHGAAKLGWVIAERGVESARALRLDAFDEERASAVIASLLPGVDGGEELARLACVRTGGAVGAIVDGTLALVHAGAIRFVDGQWRSAAEGVPAWAYAELGASRIDEKLARLRPDVRRTLATIALDGGTIDAASARLGLAADAVSRAVAPALRAGLVREGGAGLELASREVRERLESGLEPAERDALRNQAVEALAGVVDPATRAVRARHLAALGRGSEAVDDALAAGMAAAASGDLHSAAELLEDACAWGDELAARRATLALAAILASLGQIDAALAAIDRASAAGASTAVVARARGRVLARAARYEQAIEALSALASANELEAEDRFWLGWSLMMRGRYDEAEPLSARAEQAPADRARLGRLAGTIAWHRGRFDVACTILEEAKGDAAAAGDPLLGAEVEQSLGTAERLRGRLDAAAVHYGAAIDAAREGGFVGVLAKSLNNLAIVEYQSGRWERARHAWESMQELALRLDAHEEILLSHNNLGLLFQNRGEYARAERSLGKAIKIAHRRALARYEAMALGNRAEARSRAGHLEDASADLDAAEAIAQRIGADDELIECRRRRAMVRLARGDAAAALPQALSAAVDSATSGANAEAGQAYLLAAGAARVLGLIEEAERHVDAALAAWAGGATRLDAACLELEQARIAVAAGDRRGAVRIARHAGRAFAELGAERELAEVRAIEDADLAVDRGEALLEILKVAGEAADASALLDVVLGRIVELTGAERGVVITFSGDEEPRVAARRGVDGDELIVSRGIADRAIASRRALVLANVDDETDLAGRESVVHLGVRAALCAPFLQGDTCLGLLYVDSTRGPELVRFGLWVVDAAAAILAPALARLVQREREQEREALLRSAAMDALETVGAIDSALDLVADGVTLPDDLRRLAVVRDRCGALIARSERLFGLLRVDGERPRPAPETFTVRTLVASAVAALEGSTSTKPKVVFEDESAWVSGDLERLASALTRMIESATPVGGRATAVRVREVVVGTDGAGSRERAWRPGASAGRRFLRVEVSDAPEDPFGDATGALPLRAARRIAARDGGRLFAEPISNGAQIVMEIARVEPLS